MDTSPKLLFDSPSYKGHPFQIRVRGSSLIHLNKSAPTLGIPVSAPAHANPLASADAHRLIVSRPAFPASAVRQPRNPAPKQVFNEPKNLHTCEQSADGCWPTENVADDAKPFAAEDHPRHTKGQGEKDEKNLNKSQPALAISFHVVPQGTSPDGWKKKLGFGIQYR